MVRCAYDQPCHGNTIHNISTFVYKYVRFLHRSRLEVRHTNHRRMDLKIVFNRSCHQNLSTRCIGLKQQGLLVIGRPTVYGVRCRRRRRRDSIIRSRRRALYHRRRRCILRSVAKQRSPFSSRPLCSLALDSVNTVSPNDGRVIIQ